MKARLGERRNLMTPGMGKLRPAMAEHDQRALSLLTHEQLDPVGGDGALGGQIAFPPRFRDLVAAHDSVVPTLPQCREKAVLFAVVPPVRTPGTHEGDRRWHPRLSRSKGPRCRAEIWRAA